jgi:hypothetical protein
VAIRQKRGPRLHVGLDERLDRCGLIVGDSGEAESSGSRIDILGVLAAWVSLIGVAINREPWMWFQRAFMASRGIVCHARCCESA